MAGEQRQPIKHWHKGMIGIRVLSDTEPEIVHIVPRENLADYLREQKKPPSTSKRRYIWRGGTAKTCCGHVLNLDLLDAYSEAEEADVNCEACIKDYEESRARTKEFFESGGLEKLIEYWKELKRWKEDRQQWELTREAEEARFRLIQRQGEIEEKCFSHLKESIFTLGLPDEITFRLSSMGGVGEVMLRLVWGDNLLKALEDKVGKEGVAVIESVLISKGYFTPDDLLVDMEFPKPINSG